MKYPRLTAILFAAVGAVSCATAQTSLNWLSSATAGDYGWYTTTNWSSSNVPDFGGERAVFNTAANTLVAGTFNVTLGSNTTIAGVTLANNGSNDALVNLVGSGQLILNNTVATNTALLQRGGSGVIGKLTINNTISLADTEGVFLTSFGAFRLNGAISGSSAITKNGNAAVYLGGANDFSSNVLLNSGVIQATATNAFSGASAGTYTFNTASTTGNTSPVATGIGTYATGTTTFNNAIVLGTGGTGFTTAAIGFTTNGTGSVLDITSNSITDNGTASNGAITIGKVAADANYGLTQTAGTGTVKFSGTGFTIARNVTGGLDTSALELSPASGTQTWNGAITGFDGASTITKSGAGTVILGGNNSYSAATLVNEGTLLLNGTNSGLGAVSVGASGALGGTGSVAAAISFADGAKIVLNTSAALTVAGAVTFSNFDIGDVSGLSSATIAGTYLLLDGGGSNINFAGVANIGQGSAANLGNGVTAWFDTANGDLAVTVLSAIPEPSAFAMLAGLGVLGLAAGRRRRG